MFKQVSLKLCGICKADSICRGIPLYSVGLTALFAPLTYLSCSTGPAKVFIWLANLGTLVALTSWMAICVTYLRFYAALKAQGVDRDQMVFKSPFQPYLAWSTLIFFSVLTFFNGFYSFMPWNVETFITTYIGLPIFLALFTFWKLFKKTKFVKPSEADLWTGKAAIDAEVWPDTVPRNLLEKVSPSSCGTIDVDLIHLCLTYISGVGLDCVVLMKVFGRSTNIEYLSYVLLCGFRENNTNMNMRAKHDCVRGRRYGLVVRQVSSYARKVASGNTWGGGIVSGNRDQISNQAATFELTYVQAIKISECIRITNSQGPSTGVACGYVAVLNALSNPDSSAP